MRRWLAVVLALMAPAAAAEDFDLDLTAVNSDFAAICEDLTAALTYKPLAPPEATGLLGIGVGVFGSYTTVENEDAWRRASGEDIEQLGIVGVTVAKGLPWNIDVGAIYTTVPNIDVQLLGAELRVALLEGSTVSPAVALRASYTRLTGIDDFDFDTMGADVSISKGFAFLTPYIGAGRVLGRARPSDRFAFLDDQDIEASKLFGGVRITIVLLELTVEADRTGDNTSYNARVGLSF